MIKVKLKNINYLVVFFCFIVYFIVFPYRTYAMQMPIVNAKAAILIEETTGKMLYSKNENDKVYPASMTKILTSLVTLEHLNLDDIVVVGTEINDVPIDSSKAGNIVGEHILVENLIRLIIIPSGNETSCVAAKAVALKVTGKDKMPYKEAEEIFCNLMNEKAKEIGAVSSNFVNPHGYHDDNHYTTAHDMALIAKEALKNDLIRKVVKEKEFVGNGAGPNFDPSLKTKEYNWTTHNLLLNDKDYYYPFATGIKTGRTGEAGDCLAASAEKDGIELISVVFDSPDNGRWQDSINLMNYGFDNYSFQAVQKIGDIVDTKFISNPKLGETDTLDIVVNDTFTDFLSNNELERIKKDIIYDESFLAINTANESSKISKLKAPIEEGTVIGTIKYSLDGVMLYEGSILSSANVEERTFKTDFIYYLDLIKKNIFTLKALPIWAIFLLLIVGIIKIRSSVINRRNKSMYKLNKRY